MTKDEALRIALEAMKINNNAWKFLAESGDAGDWQAEEQGYYQLNEKAITAVESLLEAKDEPCCYGGIAHDCHAGKGCKIAERLKTSAKAKDEPVAWRTYTGRGYYIIDKTLEEAEQNWPDRPHSPLYTTPPQRTWVGLTDEEIQEIVSDASRAGTLSWTGYKEDDEGKYTIPVLSLSDYQFARAIEAKLRSKNYDS